MAKLGAYGFETEALRYMKSYWCIKYKLKNFVEKLKNFKL